MKKNGISNSKLKGQKNTYKIKHLPLTFLESPFLSLWKMKYCIGKNGLCKTSITQLWINFIFNAHKSDLFIRLSLAYFRTRWLSTDCAFSLAVFRTGGQIFQEIFYGLRLAITNLKPPSRGASSTELQSTTRVCQSPKYWNSVKDLISLPGILQGCFFGVFFFHNSS